MKTLFVNVIYFLSLFLLLFYLYFSYFRDLIFPCPSSSSQFPSPSLHQEGDKPTSIWLSCLHFNRVATGGIYRRDRQTQKRGKPVLVFAAIITEGWKDWNEEETVKSQIKIRTRIEKSRDLYRKLNWSGKNKHRVDLKTATSFHCISLPPFFCITFHRDSGIKLSIPPIEPRYLAFLF